MLTRTAGTERIADICRSVSVSRKHLNDLFDTHIGLTPKTYARMFRFRRVVDLVQRGQGLDWTRIAMSCGYYDQAHFNHEFREFSGMSPGEYAAAGSVDGLTVRASAEVTFLQGGPRRPRYHPSMPEINVWAVLAAGVSSMVLGGLWYSPVLFGKAWSAASGVTEAQQKSANMAKIMGTAFVLAVIGAAVFAMFLGPRPALGFATAAGLSAGLCWVAGSFGINYLFEQRSMRLFLINGGYHTVQYTLIGAVLGLWH